MRGSDPDGGMHRHDARRSSVEDGPLPDTGHVLVVAQSRVNLIVVTEIVQRCGLKAVPESIDGAGSHLRTVRPCLVILDGGADNSDCLPVYDDIAALQRTSETGMPRVILLSNRNGTAESLSLPALVDAVVAKPITPERLQPVVDRLARGKA